MLIKKCALNGFRSNIFQNFTKNRGRIGVIRTHNLTIVSRATCTNPISPRSRNVN